MMTGETYKFPEMTEWRDEKTGRIRYRARYITGKGNIIDWWGWTEDEAKNGLQNHFDKISSLPKTTQNCIAEFPYTQDGYLRVPPVFENQ